MMQLILLTCAMLPVAGQADTPVAGWKMEIEAGNKAIATRDYAGALARFRTALQQAEAIAGEEAGVLQALRGCARSSRLNGRPDDAEQFLSRTAKLIFQIHGGVGPEAASILSELAAVQRARGERKEALENLQKANRIRESLTDAKPEEVARDLTSAALLEVAMEDPAAKQALLRALSAWEAAAPPDSPQLLPVLDALASLYRDHAEYTEAEALYQRALAIREAVLGPDSSELLATLDSLAYVYFGQRKFTEAEPVYKRLLALWQSSAGPEHPMVALTFDKMAEFYAFQQRYEEAESAASAALAMRTVVHIASLNQTGCVLLMEAKLEQAEGLYRRAIQIGELAKATDETLDPVLRIYARLLEERKRDEEASAINKRVKDALFRKGEREGRRPSPVKLPGGQQ